MARVQCGDQQFDSCTAPVKLDVEDGRTVAYPAIATSCGRYDRTDLDRTMPAAIRGWRRDADGPGTAVLDQAAMVNAALAQHNAGVPGVDGGCGGCDVVQRPPRAPLVALATLWACVALARRRPSWARNRRPRGTRKSP